MKTEAMERMKVSETFVDNPSLNLSSLFSHGWVNPKIIEFLKS